MTKLRYAYALLITVTVGAGLLSRQLSLIPVATGDLLWAVMVFLIIRFYFICVRLKTVAPIALLVCYLVELSQLYHAPWIDNIRDNTFGALVLGKGFLWTDLFAYTIGVCAGFFVASMLEEKVKSKRIVEAKEDYDTP